MIPKSEREVLLLKKIKKLVCMVALIKHHNTKACRRGNKHRKICLFIISITSGRFADEKHKYAQHPTKKRHTHPPALTHTLHIERLQ